VDRDLIRKYFLEANPREDRSDCPDEDTLKAVAENRLPVTHPARLHLESCSPCFAEFRSFKLEAEDRRRRRWTVAGAVAACLLVGFLLWLRPARFVERQRTPGNATALVARAEVTRDLDLSNYGTTRGVGDDAVEIKEVALPTAVVNLRIQLPRLSEPGRYHVAVAADRAGNKMVAQGDGIATGSDPHTMLTVTLDLRKAAPGSYFLSTERDQDAGAYYYPLKLQ